VFAMDVSRAVFALSGRAGDGNLPVYQSCTAVRQGQLSTRDTTFHTVATNYPSMLHKPTWTKATDVQNQGGWLANATTISPLKMCLTVNVNVLPLLGTGLWRERMETGSWRCSNVMPSTEPTGVIGLG
jgi:hypothetical protein